MDWMSLVVIPIIKSLVMIIGLLTAFAYLTWYERKLVARFQVRYGPNRAWKFGLGQPVADALKAIFKEEVVPGHVDKPVYLLAPALSLFPAIVAFAVVPIGPSVMLFGRKVDLFVADVNIALLYVLAIASVGTYGIMLAGWSSNNNYSILGALRTAAQMVSYELPMGILLASFLIITGTLSLRGIVETPRPLWQSLWMMVAFIPYFICALAETNRSPFDLPETENELIAGFQTEYGGIKFALFFMSEYINMITSSAIMTTLFFGGWKGPFVAQFPWLGIVYFFLKVIALLFLFIWVRASIPRARYDQLMHFTWKFLMPLSLVYMAVTAILKVVIG